MWWIGLFIYFIVGFFAGHKDAPSFQRYEWVDWKILVMMVFIWPVVLIHDAVR